ncbi:MAG TPA: ATPase, T2SS/T4P/T4SS family [Candidatus Limnocylindrales bacterium]|nr:ATPase, T2SS/T4P/T4SS family [Candidatus Limnocylindrales bacterium]
MAKFRIGEILLEKGLITEDQLRQALKIQEMTGKKLGSILVELKYLRTRNLGQILANIYKVPSIDLGNYSIKVEMARILPKEYCYQKHIVPLQIKDKNLIVAMTKPNDYSTIREVEFITNLRVTAVVAPETSIDRALEDLFNRAQKEEEKATLEQTSHEYRGKRLDRDSYLMLRSPEGLSREDSSLPDQDLPFTYALNPSESQVESAPGIPSEKASKAGITSGESPEVLTFQVDQPAPEISPVIPDEEFKTCSSDQTVSDKTDKPLIVGKDEKDQILNRELSKAIEKGAEYVHLELNERGFEIKVRISGKLEILSTLSRDLFRPLIRELKELSSVDPMTWGCPQKGFFKFPYQQSEIPITSHFFPYRDLIRVVLHIQRRFDSSWSLDRLGFSPSMYKSFQEVLSYPRGIILFSGPPGNGKTTTIYTALKELISEKRAIVTYESPIRYQLQGVFQTEPENKYEANYITGLSDILDQNPDVLYVDRVVDPQSAQLLFHENSSYAKIFIRSTLDSSLAALSYFLELLRNSHVLLTSLNAVLTQRLVNRLCDHCKSAYTPSPRTQERIKQLLGITDFVLYKSDGCEKCQHTGFRGRTAIFELLVMDDKVRSRLIAESKESLSSLLSEVTLKKIFYSPETVTLMNDGLGKALQGVTTIAEVARVIGLGNYTRMLG